MAIQWIVAFTGLLVIFQLDPCQTGPCEDYKLMDMHQGRRESTYQPTSTDQLPCDDDVDSATWMRFFRDGESYQVTTSNCVPINHCGTSSPLWIDQRSTLPTVVNSESTVKVCLNYGLAFCCSIIGDATVRLCNDLGDKFYIYKLPKPHGCYSSYCVDPVAGACGPKLKKGPNQGPCVSYFPEQNRPTLEGPTIDGRTIKFYCAVAYSGPADMAANARFEVRFLFDGIVDPDVPVATVSAGNKALLDQQHLRGHFGKDLSCGTRAYWQHDPDTKGDETRSENGYTIGVRADNHRITISEADGSPTEVLLKSSLPVLCKDPSRPCRVCTRVVTENMALNEQCEYCFKPEDWKPGEMKAYDSTSPLKVNAVKNPRLDEPAIYYIDFAPFTYKYDMSSGSGQDTLWTGYEMNDIQVSFKDSTHGQCSAVGDPHIFSFDNKYFNVFHIGQFLMWKSTAERHLEVHVRFWRCLSHITNDVSCVCAVAVREGNAIFGVDRCGPRSLDSVGRLKVTRYSPKGWTIPEEAFVSSDGGNNYYINMPSGTYVRAEFSQWFGLNIYIHGLAEDKTKSSGLCGNFDGNPQNDLKLKGTDTLDPSNDQIRPTPVSFSKSYRIPRGESFFDSTPQLVTVDEPDVVKCRCDEGAIECSRDADVQRPPRQNQEKTPTLQKPVNANNRGRRRKRDVEKNSLSDDIDEEEDNFDYGDDFVPNVQLSWPTPNGLTESEVRDFCRRTFDALEFKDECLAKTKVSLDDSIRTCIEDIQIYDNTSWAQASVGSFEEACEFLYLQNASLYNKDPEGELQPPLQLLGKICPNQCSRRGACSDGICVCNTGFTGFDCSLEEGVPPVLHYIPGSDRCDLTQRPCKEFRLVASRFMKSEKLTCRVTELKSKATAGDQPVSHDSTIMTVSEGTAKFVTIAEISCKLPDIASQDMAYYQLLFDFSYDGEQYSNRVMLTVFDGECLECDNNCEEATNWNMQPDSCLIDGRCAMDGDIYNVGGCFTCEPDRSQSSWTEVSVDRCGGELIEPTSPDTDSSPTKEASTTTSTEKSTTTTTEKSNPTTTETEGGTDDNNLPVIAGAVVGLVVVVFIVVVVSVVCWKRRQAHKDTDKEKHIYMSRKQEGAENDYQGLFVPGGNLYERATRHTS